MTTYEWKKFPSVTTGGKPYFWLYYEGKKIVASVVWNRIEKMYAVEIEETNMGYMENLKSAKKNVETIVKLGETKK